MLQGEACVVVRDIVNSGGFQSSFRDGSGAIFALSSFHSLLESSKESCADCTQPQGRLPSTDCDSPRTSTRGPPLCCPCSSCPTRRFPASRHYARWTTLGSRVCG